MTADDFERCRPRLMAVAYGMLGSVADAEDVVQEAWLRWAATDVGAVREPAAFLTTVVSRLALDRLRSAHHRRETYVGTWLPEPIVTDLAGAPDDVVVEAEELSMALLSALERLNPVERAVLLLRDVFDLDYGEIAPVVDRTTDNCRQIARRARDHAGDEARRTPVDPERDREVVEAFLDAVADGGVEDLIEVLAADVISWSDGGGRRRAARHPVMGASRVAAFWATIARQGRALGATARIVRANGRLALMGVLDGVTQSVVTFDVADGRIVAIRTVLNPDKLVRAGGPDEADDRPRDHQS